MAGRRLLGLVVVLALLLVVPARALADESGVWQKRAGTTVLAVETTTTEDPAPSDPAPATEPATPSDPAPSDPAPAPDPAPSDPAPAPSDPAPAPSDPAPAPSDPAPAPAEPAPAPSDPAPAPSEPTPPADTVPAPSDPVPSDPAPRDTRTPAPKPPASDEHQVPPASAPAPATALAPTATTPTDPTDEAAKTPDRTAAPDGRAADQTKAVRVALHRLGIGTIAAPAASDTGTTVAAALASACTPIGTVATAAAPQVGAQLVTHPAPHTHRVDDDPPLVRGPPAPLHTPSSPIATAGVASAATGGVGGERDCAILAHQLAYTVDENGSAVAVDCCDHVAPASANAAARAPPLA